jgi:hypothetical protein
VKGGEGEMYLVAMALQMGQTEKEEIRLREEIVALSCWKSSKTVSGSGIQGVNHFSQVQLIEIHD